MNAWESQIESDRKVFSLRPYFRVAAVVLIGVFVWQFRAGDRDVPNGVTNNLSPERFGSMTERPVITSVRFDSKTTDLTDKNHIQLSSGTTESLELYDTAWIEAIG